MKYHHFDRVRVKELRICCVVAVISATLHTNYTDVRVMYVHTTNVLH